MEASAIRSDGLHGPALAYSAPTEGKLDHPLEFLKLALPQLPVNFKPADDMMAKVYVTFYVSERGRVRVPNVESSASAELIPGAVAAVQQWVFEPPAVVGKPVLVLTGRPVRFLPRAPGVEHDRLWPPSACNAG